eukprot:4351242-Prymnesium_polylepis.1
MAVSLLQLALTGIFAVSSLLQLALTGIFAKLFLEVTVCEDYLEPNVEEVAMCMSGSRPPPHTISYFEYRVPPFVA